MSLKQICTKQLFLSKILIKIELEGEGFGTRVEPFRRINKCPSQK